MVQNKDESLLALLNGRKDEYLAKCEICLLTSILLITLLGNSLVLILLYVQKYRTRKKFTKVYFFIVNLSIVDLLTGFFNILPQLAWRITFRFQGGVIPCKIVKFLQPLAAYLSSYILTAMAIDRYQAICYPKKYGNVISTRSTIIVYCFWIIANLLCLPQIFVFSYREILPNVWDCWITFDSSSAEKIYIIWYSITVFLLPSFILFYVYIGIYISMKKNNSIGKFIDRKKYMSANFLEQNYNLFASEALTNSGKLTMVLISLYLITRTPFIGYLLWTTWNHNTPIFTDGPILVMLMLLSNCTSCINPWIYLLYNRELLSLFITRSSRRDIYILSYDDDIHHKTSKAPS